MTAPTSTYRLQIQPEFTLDDAADLVSYLNDLGVGAVYLSPILTSTTGSTHGYDTTDPTTIDPQRGGDAGWQALLLATEQAGIKVVLDIVPNHLGIAAPEQNRAWWDVLTHGRDSAYAAWFDIDWSRERITVPILGEDHTLTLADGELRYFEHRFPLAEGTWSDGDDPETVHARQHYELIDWRRGDAELSYRRFFTVATLAGVRVEDQAVFDGTHGLIADLVAQGGLRGLRIDHPDGLVDPGDYLRKLRAIAPQAWITVEKILEPHEELQSDWHVAGTTGYDAMRDVGGLFIDPSTAADFTDLYQRLTGDRLSLAEHVARGKTEILAGALRAEVARIAALAPEVGDAAEVVAALAVAFAVYRSYLPHGRERLDAAREQVAATRPELRTALESLQSRLADPDDELARRLQQLSGATMAKGTEDTAFYRYSRFLGLNEVGGDADQFGLPLAQFHQAQLERQARWPESMTTLSTHDTKRSEDVRARLAVLSEMPAEWSAFAEQFLAVTGIEDHPLAYLLAQTVVGAGDIGAGRLAAYAQKAMREAGVGTCWTDPDPAFEDSVQTALGLLWSHTELAGGWRHLLELVQGPGWSNALAAKAIQLTMPGIPDVYQGTELWDDSLVDPDNRRLVDFTARRTLLGLLHSPGAHTPDVDGSGAAKLWVTHRCLELRRDRPELFSSYAAVVADGAAADHLIGFDRGGAITLATRLPVGLAAVGGWGTTTVVLPGRFHDHLTGAEFDGTVAVADVLGTYPVAVLRRV